MNCKPSFRYPAAGHQLVRSVLGSRRSACRYCRVSAKFISKLTPCLRSPIGALDCRCVRAAAECIAREQATRLGHGLLNGLQGPAHCHLSHAGLLAQDCLSPKGRSLWFVKLSGRARSALNGQPDFVCACRAPAPLQGYHRQFRSFCRSTRSHIGNRSQDYWRCCSEQHCPAAQQIVVETHHGM